MMYEFVNPSVVQRVKIRSRPFSAGAMFQVSSECTVPGSTGRDTAVSIVFRQFVGTDTEIFCPEVPRNIRINREPSDDIRTPSSADVSILL